MRKCPTCDAAPDELHKGRPTGDGACLMPTRAGRIGDTQDMPKPNDREHIHDLVSDDIAEKLRASNAPLAVRLCAEFARRKALGVERYGTPLQPRNGRKALLDAREELVDAAVYLRQAMEEAQLDADDEVQDSEKYDQHLERSQDIWEQYDNLLNMLIEISHWDSW